MDIIRINKLNKSYGKSQVLSDVTLSIQQGEFVAIQGKSGSGKSTLLNIIGLLEQPDNGEFMLFDQPAPKPFSAKAREILRNQIGFLFQNYALLDDKSVKYNLKIVLEKSRTKDSERRIHEALKLVALQGFEKKKVAECSGGEQQRVAMARLLLTPCSLILADEPTANLDPENRDLIAKLLLKLKDLGKTIIMVTHDQQMAVTADRILLLENNTIR